MPLDDMGQTLAPLPPATPGPAPAPSDATTAAPPPPDVRGLIAKSREMGASDDQIRDLMVKAPFLANTWQASEKAGIPPDAVFQHFGVGAPDKPAAQSQLGADINAVGQGVVSGTGSAIAGAGRTVMAAGSQGTQHQLAVMDAIDRGESVPQDQDAIGYQFLSPEQRAKARADFSTADAELSKAEPNALVRAGTAIGGAAPGLFPVAPENEGIQTGAARMIGGAAPALAASAIGGPAGMLASMAVIGSQAYEGTYQDAIAKGASPADAEDAAGKSAAAQAVTQVLPIGRLIQRVPVPLRDGLMKTLFNLGQHGVEFGSANAVGTFANNYVAQQTYDPDRPLTQGTGDSALEGTIAGLVIRGAAVGAQSGRDAVAAIGAAPDIDSAIAAAGQAAVATTPGATDAQPLTGWGDIFPPSTDATGKAAAIPVAPDFVPVSEAPPRIDDLFPETAPAAEAPLAEPTPTTLPDEAPPPEPAPTADTTPRPTTPPTTAAEARAVASDYYRQAESLGGDLTPDFTNRFIDSAEKIAPQTEEGRIVTGDTAVTSLVDRMQGLRDRPLSLQAAQEIDEALGSLIDKEYGVAGMSKEGKQLLDLQTTLRGMIADAGEGDVQGGTQGFEALGLARQAWSQAAKMGDVERILNRAALTDNPATSVKSGIRVLLSNPSRVRGYSPAEIDALKDAASRGVIGGTLHVFGSRLTPLIAGSLGLTGGPLAGIATAGIAHAAGSVMRGAAASLQGRRAQNALSVIGSGVPPAVEQAIREAAPAVRSPEPNAEPTQAMSRVQREQAAIVALAKLRKAAEAGEVDQSDPMIGRILRAAYGDDFKDPMTRTKLTGLLGNFARELQARSSFASQIPDQAAARE